MSVILRIIVIGGIMYLVYSFISWFGEELHYRNNFSEINEEQYQIVTNSLKDGCPSLKEKVINDYLIDDKMTRKEFREFKKVCNKNKKQRIVENLKEIE